MTSFTSLKLGAPNRCLGTVVRSTKFWPRKFFAISQLELRTYGPRMLPDDGRVVSNFIVQALKGEALTPYGDGSQTRSFCFVDDLIEGMIRLMNGAHTGPINIGNPTEFTIRQLAELVREKINPELELICKPLPQDDPLQRQPVIELAQIAWN